MRRFTSKNASRHSAPAARRAAHANIENNVRIYDHTTDVLGYMLHPLTAAVGNAFNTNLDFIAAQYFKSTPEYSVLVTK